MDIKITARQQNIIDILAEQQNSSISLIKKHLQDDISIPTLNRDIADLVVKSYLIKKGAGRGTSYSLSPFYNLFAPLNIENYFDIEPDFRDASTQFNFELFSSLFKINLLTSKEEILLENLKNEYHNNISDISSVIYKKEIERLTIELSWKSSQIEGNTYSLLETERLFLEQETAIGKPKEDASMLLNHKDALNYILKNKNIAQNLDLKTLEEIHSILIKGLGINKNIRSRSVGITGSIYKPLDNAYQIKENLQVMCDLINSKQNGFEKALLAVALISYIQPFEDGNKRTGRMISNALLIAYNACPLSYRSIDAMDYKKAMLLFYEKNNLTAFKKIFIEQNIFAVKNYFQ